MDLHPLIFKVSQEIGLPFAIRSTVSRFYKGDNIVPLGDSGSEGIGGDSVTHYFVVNEKILSRLDVDEQLERLRRSIIKSVFTYSRDHEGAFKKGKQLDYPILFLFPCGNVNSDYGWPEHETYAGEPTFPEAYGPKGMRVSDKGIFVLDERGYDQCHTIVQSPQMAKKLRSEHSGIDLPRLQHFKIYDLFGRKLFTQVQKHFI